MEHYVAHLAQRTGRSCKEAERVPGDFGCAREEADEAINVCHAIETLIGAPSTMKQWHDDRLKP